jgi:hypothetical protein
MLRFSGGRGVLTFPDTFGFHSTGGNPTPRSIILTDKEGPVIAIAAAFDNGKAAQTPSWSPDSAPIVSIENGFIRVKAKIYNVGDTLQDLTVDAPDIGGGAAFSAIVGGYLKSAE